MNYQKPVFFERIPVVRLLSRLSSFPSRVLAFAVVRQYLRSFHKLRRLLLEVSHPNIQHPHPLRHTSQVVKKIGYGWVSVMGRDLAS